MSVEDGNQISRREFLETTRNGIGVYLARRPLVMALTALFSSSGMVMADRLAWTSEQFAPCDPALGLMTLAQALVGHDRANRDKLGIRTNAADIARADDEAILYPYLNDPDLSKRKIKAPNSNSLGGCNGLVAAEILESKPQTTEGIALLIALHRADNFVYLTDPNLLGTEEGRQAEIDAQIENFFETKIPFMVEAPLGLNGLWYRAVNGVSLDGQTLRVGNFGKPDIDDVRRNQIKFACQLDFNPDSNFYIKKQIIPQTIYNLALGYPLPEGDELEQIRQKFPALAA